MNITTQERAGVLRLAAERAALAPSIHNTQPWRFRIRDDALEMLVDPDRQLEVHRPRPPPAHDQLRLRPVQRPRRGGRKPLLELTVERFPEPGDPDLFARLTLGEPQAPWTPLVRLDDAIERRRSNRREFFEHRVSEEVVWELTTAAAAEDAIVVHDRGPGAAPDRRRADPRGRRDRERRPRLPGRAPAVDDHQEHPRATA